jgi:MFS family permease
MAFAIRARLETVFGPAGVGLTLEQVGYAFMPPFWGFTLAMIAGGPVVDYLGMKKGMWIAFVLHAIGIVATLFATDLTSLFLATVFMGLGNGMVEAVCNSLVASMYPRQKTMMLNRFHLWWPAGIVIEFDTRLPLYGFGRTKRAGCRCDAVHTACQLRLSVQRSVVPADREC